MPPKAKITKDEIIAITLNLLRAEGEDAMNARAIAAALGCSTQPVFSNFTSMEELQHAVLGAAYEYYHGFLTEELQRGKHPPLQGIRHGVRALCQAGKQPLPRAFHV